MRSKVDLRRALQALSFGQELSVIVALIKHMLNEGVEKNNVVEARRKEILSSL